MVCGEREVIRGSVTRRNPRSAFDRSVSVERPGLLRCQHDQVGRGAGVKAVVYDRYGSPDLLRVEEVPVPSPAAGLVRVKIAATSVNLSDWECLRGAPAYARIGGLRFPACRTLGSDIAGLVDDVIKKKMPFIQAVIRAGEMNRTRAVLLP